MGSGEKGKTLTIFPRLVALTALVFLHTSVVFAAPLSSLLSESEFITAANLLAPRVNLFQEIWSKDPHAEIYGGSSRDFLFWLRDELEKTNTPAEAHARIQELLTFPSIDVREFLSVESDLDVVSDQTSLRVDVSAFGIRKFDLIAGKRVDPATEEGRSEVLQGYLPTEKIRIQATGLKVDKTFGDGIKEIYTGEFTAKFSRPDDFAKSHYAKQSLNHPVLLGLRYIRLLSLDAFRRSRAPLHLKSRGEVPEVKVDTELSQKLSQVFDDARNDPEFRKCLDQPRFLMWFKRIIDKSFRVTTHPGLTKALYDRFNVSRLLQEYRSFAPPINQYLFARKPDPTLVAKSVAQFSASDSSWTKNTSDFFSDGILYHGTPTLRGFEAILLQGVLPSESSFLAFGPGLYGVETEQMDLAHEYARGQQNHIVGFPISPQARIADLTQGAGLEVYRKFREANLDIPKDSLPDEFAAAFGLDVLKYTYGEAGHAFVVKNSRVLGQPFGKFWTLKPFLELVKDLKTDIQAKRFGSVLLHLTSSQIIEKEAIFALDLAFPSPEAQAAYLDIPTRDKNSHFPLSASERKSLGLLMLIPYALTQIQTIDDIQLREQELGRVKELLNTELMKAAGREQETREILSVLSRGMKTPVFAEFLKTFSEELTAKTDAMYVRKVDWPQFRRELSENLILGSKHVGRFLYYEGGSASIALGVGNGLVWLASLPLGLLDIGVVNEAYYTASMTFGIIGFFYGMATNAFQENLPRFNSLSIPLGYSTRAYYDQRYIRKIEAPFRRLVRRKSFCNAWLKPLNPFKQTKR